VTSLLLKPKSKITYSSILKIDSGGEEILEQIVDSWLFDFYFELSISMCCYGI
jgi:hypothetical protein